jgi:hypothetical protein
MLARFNLHSFDMPINSTHCIDAHVSYRAVLWGPKTEPGVTFV